jgi:hypothetical protein
MKTKLTGSSRVNGAALLTALIICTTLSLVLMYYLSLVQQQTLISSRSQSWNMAIGVAEAGVEDGLQQLSDNASNLVADGWAYNGLVYKSPTRSLPDGSYYQAFIDFSSDPFNPAVTSIGTEIPHTFAFNQTAAFMATIGSSSASPSITRAVVVRCSRSNPFIKGLAVKQTIDMNGNNVEIDSFDSTDPTKSTAGQYDPTKYIGTNGDIATNMRLINGISGGNANIYGHVMVGQGGTMSLGPQGGVGDPAWQAANPGQIEPGYFSDNANFTFPDQSFPYTTGLPPLSGFITVTNYTFSTNAVVGSSTYPNPPPAGGVITNVSYKTVSNYPNQPNTTTNCDSTILKSKTFPAVGAFCGTPWQSGNGGNNSSDWYFYAIASYTYSTVTYTYNLYTTNATVTSTYYDHILYSGDYYLATPLSGSTLVLGNARLVLPQGINMSGNDVLQIAQGASLKVFAGGANDSIGGNGVLNQSGFASNLQMSFTPATTSLSLGGNAEFIGTILAPEANVQMNGGGKSNTDFVGSLMANSVKMNGQFSFHYDEALGHQPSSSRFLISSWNEVDPKSLPSGYFAAQ